MPSFNRDGVKRRLVEVLAHTLGDEWTVSYEWPGDDFTDSYLYLDAAVNGDGTNTALPAAPGTKRLKTDTFSFTALLCSSGHYTAEDAERAAGDGVRLVDDKLRELRRLRDPAGVIPDGATKDYAGCDSAAITTVQGPAATAPQSDGDPIAGLCLLTITCTSQL